MISSNCIYGMRELHEIRIAPRPLAAHMLQSYLEPIFRGCPSRFLILSFRLSRRNSDSMPSRLSPRLSTSRAGRIRSLVPMSRAVGRGEASGGDMEKRLGRHVRPFRAVFGSSFFVCRFFRRRLLVELLGSHLDCLGDVAAIVIGVASAGDSLFLDPSVVGLD